MAPAQMAAEADYCSGRRRFAVACSVLSRCIRAEAAAAHSRSVAQAQVASPMLLMPGAVIVPDAANAEPASAQLTIVYGGHVVVFNDVRPDRAAELMRVAGPQDMSGGLADLRVARKASLQRLMVKRRDRIGARAAAAVSRKKTPTHGLGWVSQKKRMLIRPALTVPT